MYAYGQTELHPDTLDIVTYRLFKTGCYGLTITPPVSQQIMDQTLLNIIITYAFIDAILIVTKGTKDQHMKKVEKVLKVITKRDFE